jgi:hypothetical protein
MPDVVQHSPYNEAPADGHALDDEKTSGGAQATGPDALNEALRHASEAREYFLHWLAAEADRLKLRLRHWAIWAIVGLTGLAILLAIVMTAAGLLLIGIAELIGSLLGERPWLGAIITGAGLLLIAALAVGIGLWSWNASAFEAVRHRFAARRRLQRAKFGRSVEPIEDEHSSGHKP